MWMLDRIDSWLNGRDDAAVEDELFAVDAQEANPKLVATAQDALNEAEEPAGEADARRMVAEAKAHEREVDIAESDSDDWGPPDWTPPERRERLEIEESEADLLMPEDEDRLEGPQ